MTAKRAPIVKDAPLTVGRPIGATPLWDAVIAKAGRRCECRGRACGSSHSATGKTKRKKGDPEPDDRCGRTLEAGYRLLALPADASIPTDEAWKVPASQCVAWCEKCHDGAKRKAGQGLRQQAVTKTKPVPHVPGQIELLGMYDEGVQQ